jgi:hypothetical protein
MYGFHLRYPSDLFSKASVAKIIRLLPVSLVHAAGPDYCNMGDIPILTEV